MDACEDEGAQYTQNQYPLGFVWGSNSLARHNILVEILRTRKRHDARGSAQFEGVCRSSCDPLSFWPTAEILSNANELRVECP